MEELNGGGTEAPRENAKHYHAIKIWITVIDIASNFLFTAALAFSGISAFIVNYVISPHISNEYLSFLAFLAIVSLAGGAIGLPLDFYGSFIVEHRFGLSNQGIGRWAFERVKTLLVNLAIGIPLALVFFAFLRTAVRLWWLYLAATVFLSHCLGPPRADIILRFIIIQTA
jgi:STE24 endopeptidase